MEELIPKDARERIEQIGRADLVVGVLASDNSEAAPALVREAVGALATPVRAVLVQSNGHGEANGDISRIPLSADFPGTDAISRVEKVQEAYQSIFAMGEKLQARACCVLASSLQTVSPQWISLLAQPVLEMGFDVVAPCYLQHKYEGLLNRGIISPLHRAMYGQRVENPMGPDLGFSSRVLKRMLEDGGAKAIRERPHPLASLVPIAISANFPICQANVGTRVFPPTDWTDVSSLLAQILGPVFLDLERNAPFWQRTRGSQPVPGFGESPPLPAENRTIDVQRMVESFQLGVRNLQDVWNLVLPPATLFELTKLARQPLDRFRIPDALWSRIVYDFALAHRLRVINRDHLLRAMTPLYLGWVASYALELDTAGAVAVEERFERLCVAYETTKPYMVSRWRWPDRFNP